MPPASGSAPPLTFRLPAARLRLDHRRRARNYSGMALQYDGASGFDAPLGHALPPSYPFRLRYKEDIERLQQPAAVTGHDHHAVARRAARRRPERAGQLRPRPQRRAAARPEAVPGRGSKPSGSKPGRALWSYLDGGNNTLDRHEGVRRLAARAGVRVQRAGGLLVPLARGRREGAGGLLARAGRRASCCWTAAEPLRTREKIRELLRHAEATGAAGAKIDFFDHEHKEVVDLYETLLRAAAEHQLLVDFHGANKPTGMERTWPND